MAVLAAPIHVIHAFLQRPGSQLECCSFKLIKPLPVSLQDSMSPDKPICLDIDIPVYWGCAEAMEQDDRGAPARGARGDLGHSRGAGGRARSAVTDDVADRR